MTDKTDKREAMLVKALIFTVGLLIGLGTAHVTTMAKVEGNSIKIEQMTKNIDKNNEIIVATLDLVKAAVQQNTVLINSVVGK